LAAAVAVLLIGAVVVPLLRILLAGLLLLAPGYLLCEWVCRDLHLPRLVRPALVVGLSLSIIPLAFLWFSTAGLTLSPNVLRLLLLASALLAGWRIWRSPPSGNAPAWLGAGLLLVGGLTLGLRLHQVRDVALPLWVDSVHHALLIRIAGETGQYPRSALPYVGVERLVYHWGYHVATATWQAVAQQPLGTLVLLSGQILSALHVLTIYALGAYLTRSPRAGLFAALATNLLSMMPAYYVTWGRYTQLTGLLLLPALIILSCLLIEATGSRLPLFVGTAVALAGLILIHYRVVVFYAAFMLIYVSLFSLRDPRRAPSAIARLGIAGALSGALVLPWASVLAGQFLVRVAQQPDIMAGSESYNSLDRTLLWTTNSRQLYAAAGIGALFALLKRQWRVLAAGLWIAVLFLIANPMVIGLRPSWFINNHSVVISLFLPVSILAGFAAHQLVVALGRALPAKLRRPLSGLQVALCVLLAGLGAWQFRDVVNPVTNLARTADLPALDWAAEHTPRDARFLINATPWLNGVYRGTDAGWWLTPLAGRWTSTPPAIYGYGTKEYIAEVTRRSATVASLQPDAVEQVDALIQTNQITHVFIGAAGGPLKGEMFWGRPGYVPIYDRDGVLIFDVRPPG
jgi:hypothetical protein